jgi:uncharacterized protein YjbI with pentapeptide repeats
MSEQRRFRPRKSILIAGISLVVLAIALGTWRVLFFQVAASNWQGNQVGNNTEAMNNEELQTEKLRQEVRQLQIENDRLTSPWQSIPTYATFITAVVAVAGVFLTIWKQFSERQRDRAQREAESRRQLDEKFSSIVSDIGSANQSLQVSAIVSLMTFLRPEYFEFHEQVYLILLANLKLESSSQVNRLLIQAFEKALALNLEAHRDPAHPLELDLTRTNLYHANLSGLDLSNADLGFANLRLANLMSTNLFRAKGMEVNLEKAKLTGANLNEARFAKANLANAHLHDANLVAATLKGANLNGTEFFKAKLQSAHFDDADIKEAHFEQANLRDTYFKGAKLSDSTLRSIGKAYKWEDAHFDEDVKAKIVNFVRKSND